MVQGVVSARAFELVDGDGNRRACMATDAEGNPVLQLYGSDGRTRLQVGLWRDKPSICFMGKTEANILMKLSVIEDVSGIQIYDGNGVARAVLYVDQDGESSFELWKSRTKAPVTIRVKSDGTYEGTFEILPGEFVSTPKLELVRKDREDDE